MAWFGWKPGREESRPALSRVLSGGVRARAGEWPQGYEAQVRAGYLRNAVAQRAVKLVAESVGAAPLNVGDDGLRALVTRRGLLETVAAQVLLNGNAFVQVGRDEEGKPAELFALRPERVSVEVDALGWPAAYRYTVAERVTRFAGDGVIHVRAFNPVDDHYGLGCLAAASGAIAIHNAAAAWNKALLDNAARPSGALVYDAGDGATLSAGVAARAADAGQVLASPDVLTGRTMITMFELPPTGDEAWASPRIAIAATGTASGWRQASVELSRDNGATWEAVGRTAAPAVIGTIAAPLRRGGRALIDRAGVIELALLHDGIGLESADAPRIAQGANVALLGDEVIQFARAVQVAPRRWRLSHLARAMNGSDSRDHPAGTRFVLLDRASLLVPEAGVLRIGDRIRVSVRGIGDVDGPVMADTVVDGRSVAPLAPVHLRWMAGADGSARVTWVRRSRIGWRWGDGEVPLAEERELYRVVVTSTLGTRVLQVGETSVSLLPEEWADGGVRVAVSQIGTVATSREAIITRGNQS